jgi:hypothetical protein
MNFEVLDQPEREIDIVKLGCCSYSLYGWASPAPGPRPKPKAAKAAIAKKAKASAKGAKGAMSAKSQAMAA